MTNTKQQTKLKCPNCNIKLKVDLSIIGEKIHYVLYCKKCKFANPLCSENNCDTLADWKCTDGYSRCKKHFDIFWFGKKKQKSSLWEEIFAYFAVAVGIGFLISIISVYIYLIWTAFN